MKTGFVLFIYLLIVLTYSCSQRESNPDHDLPEERPNFVFIISDDQSWLHAGAYGDNVVKTPVFDSLAALGILFNNAFAASPHCSVSRATLLTGMNQWQLEEAGTHSSGFPAKFKVLPDILESNGYHIGFTGKGWGPGNWEDFGRTRNPAGIEYNEHELKNLPTKFLGTADAAENFKSFIKEKEDNQPFWFWYGSKEPHVGYEKGIGNANGIDTAAIELPPFVPDNSETKTLMADYYFEVEWFDKELGRLIEALEESGELKNTIIIVTSDNGIIFPRAKRNLHEWGTHIPLAIYWSKLNNKGTKTDRLTSFIDFAPSILELANIEKTDNFVGSSFASLLTGTEPITRKPQFVLTGFERHDHRRKDNVGYPVRAIRTDRYLLLKNYKPERWPEGDPELNGYGTPSEITQSSWNPNYSFYPIGSVEYDLAFGKRPEYELYNIVDDPDCVENLAINPDFESITDSLYTIMKAKLIEQGDPRETGRGDIFESYPRYGSMKGHIDGFKKRGEYNPKYQVTDSNN